MARFEVTQQLAGIIKNLRTQNKVPAKRLAYTIKKSPSFITKLEKAEIKTIDSDELKIILECITNNEHEFETLLEEIYNTLELRYSNEEIKEQSWLINYDTIFCLIPVTIELINGIKDLLQQQNISLEYIIDRVNSNESIDHYNPNYEKMPYNEWQPTIENQRIIYSTIKMQLSYQDVNDLFTLKKKKCNYQTLFSIVYYIYKNKMYGTKTILTMEENKPLEEKAIQFLSKYKFYSIVEKKRLYSFIRTKEEFNEIVSNFDKENIELIKSIVSHFNSISNHDITYANKALKAFNDNLDWDCPFMLFLLSLNFNQLNNLEYENKKALLKEIRELLEQYRDHPVVVKNIMLYD